jgi:hypothetical protein
MSQIGNVAEINEVKNLLIEMQEEGSIRSWELPYENLLTKLSAAIFFITPTKPEQLLEVWKRLEKYGDVSYERNESKKLSELDFQFRISLNDEL